MSIRGRKGAHLPTTPPERVLLTGGRAPATLDLARALARAGRAVVVAESLSQPLTRSSRAVTRTVNVPSPRFHPDAYIDALLAIIRRERIDLLVPTCEEVFYVARGLDRLQGECEVLVSPLSALLPLHHKMRFIELVKEDGHAAPESWLADSRAALSALNETLPRGLWVVLKPAYSRFAARVIFTSTDKRWPRVDVSPQRPWVVQRQIEGRGLCAYAICHQGCVSAQAAYAVKWTAGVGSCIWFEPLHHPGLFTWVESFVARRQFHGQIAFDFIETGDGTLYPLECNPRTTSGLHLLADHPQLPDALAGPLARPLLPRPGTRRMLAAAMLLYGLPSIRSPRQILGWARDFASAHDVLADRRDPWPAVGQFATLAALAAVARRERISLLEASTWDIEWSEDR